MPSLKANLGFAVMVVISLGLCGRATGRKWEPTPAYMETFHHIEQLQKDVRKLPAADKSRKLRDLEQLAQQIEQTWRESDPESYGWLTNKVCGPIAVCDTGTDEQRALIQRIVKRALEKADDMSLQLACQLAGKVGGNLDPWGKPLKGNAWANLRKEQAELWLHAWQRIEKTIDKTWDPDDLPESNVAPPRGAGVPSGVAPSAIQDPQLRAEYEAAIEANRQKAERYHEQHWARKLKKRWIPRAERFIFRTYTQPPARTEELEQLLSTYVADPDKRARILKAVRTKKMPDDLIIRNTTQPAKPE